MAQLDFKASEINARLAQVETNKENISDLSQKIDETNNDIDIIDAEIFDEVEGEASFTSGCYSGEIGEEPISSAKTNYKCTDIKNIKDGWTISVVSRAGSSSNTLIYLKDGIIVALSTKPTTQTEWTVVCDGTFDELLVNDYTAYIKEPSAKYPTTVKVIGRIEDEISGIKQQMGVKSLKVLCIGNSFTQNSMGYVPALLKNISPNINLTIGIAFIGGSPLAQHWSYISGETVTIGTTTYYVSDGKYHRDIDGTTTDYNGYTFYKSANGGAWVTTSAIIEDILADEQWDVITFQQGGSTSDGDWDTYYAPYIYKLQKAVYDKMSNAFNFGWLLVHGAYATTDSALLNKWSGTKDNAVKVIDNTASNILFPYGTAIQNLRTTSLKSLGAEGYLNLLADNGHLVGGIGCLTAAYVNCIKLMEIVGEYNGLYCEDTTIDDSFITDNNIPLPSTSVEIVGISDDNIMLAQIAAEKAVINPYSVTDISTFEG